MSAGTVSAGIETGWAKLNLALHVRARMADGYHALETLFAFCEDGDVLSVTAADTLSLTIGGPFASALGGEGDNLVLRAARALAARYGVSGGAALHLDKRLPVAAGIGGGSADAAAALRLLARHWGVGDPAGLLAIAGGLGADVPACVAGRVVRGDRRGDRLSPVDEAGLRGLPVLLVNPRVPLLTGPVFAAWDGQDRGPLPDGDPLTAALAGRNDLEPPARALLPLIDAVIGALDRCDGATLVRMSGSGATCFALFEGDDARDAAATRLASEQPGWWQLASRLR